MLSNETMTEILTNAKNDNMPETLQFQNIEKKKYILHENQILPSR